ncbi:MAG: enoyl-CoA hydratase [Candidatus Hydrogenedentes bacterium]|nr:enoyl-CoA hydratase [Candidatus Hydrogenedentota bacterium]
MPYAEIIYEVSDNIATVTLNRPDKLNAWTFKMESEYKQALAEAERDDAVRVIVVTGAGRGFCAGADMGLLSSVMSGEVDTSELEAGTVSFGGGQTVPEDFRKQYSFPPSVSKPIIAAVNGPAVGIGLVHALYCDMRFASDVARFGTAFAQRGLIAEHGISWLLPRIVGIDNALDLLYSARMIDAEEALRMRLVTRVVPHDDLLPTVRAYATQLATLSSPRSMRVIKRQVWGAMLTNLGDAVDSAVNEMMESFGSEDFREGVLAFMEKRPPQFPGK